MLLLAKNSQAQMVMDTINLPEVRLTETRISTHNIGVNIDTINSTSLHESSSLELTSVINNFSSFYVKRYGALATPTFRGTSSSHTLVLWNGIPINSIANGLSDLSNIYCDNFSEIFIVNGGESSVFGSGAIGGSIHLNTESYCKECSSASFWLITKVIPSSSKKVALGLSKFRRSSIGSHEVINTKDSSSKYGLIFCKISFKFVFPDMLNGRQYYIF